MTAGANYRPCFCDQWQLRGEIRIDWSDVQFPNLNVDGMFNDFTEKEQVTLAVSAVTRF